MKQFKIITYLSIFVLNFLYPQDEKALCIEIREGGKLSSEIIMSLDIAKMIIEETGKEDFDIAGAEISREELEKLLSYGGELATVENYETDTQIRFFIQEFKFKRRGSKGGKNFIVEVYNYEDDNFFKLRIPLVIIRALIKISSWIDIRYKNYVGSEMIEKMLSREGGIMYVRDYKQDAEIWIYIE